MKKSDTKINRSIPEPSGKAKTQQKDWREDVLLEVRKLMKRADSGIVEERKWKKPTNPLGIPVWYYDGSGICTGEVYKDHVKLTFFKGASLKDPSHLFNQDGTVRRAIDIHEGYKINEQAFIDLVRAAAELNSTTRE